ncbi:MAG TPA: hypothetical protein VGD37_06630 [Kofleriaceae bacterium]|jgi:hypothetical protein
MLRISLALVLASAACYHEGAAPPSNKLAPSAEPMVAADPLSFLPLDSDIVLGIDIRALRASALWKEYLPRLTQAVGANLAEVQRRCGFDPIQAIDSVTIGTRTKDTSDTVVVIRGPERDRTVACLQSNVAPGTTVTTVPGDRGVLLVASKNGARNLATFADRSTLVLVGATRSTPDALRAVLRGGAPLRGSQGFVAAFDRLEPGATMWLVVNGKALIFDQMAVGGVRPLAMYGTLRVGDGLQGRLHVRLTTPDEAAKLAGVAQTQIQPAAAMVDRLTATAEGDVMTVAADMSIDKVRALASMLLSVAGSALTSP